MNSQPLKFYQTGTFTVGKQPSGLSFNAAGSPRARRQPRRQVRQRIVGQEH